MLNWTACKNLTGNREGGVTTCKEYSIIKPIDGKVFELCGKRGVIWYSIEFSEDKEYLKSQAEKHNNAR